MPLSTSMRCRDGAVALPGFIPSFLMWGVNLPWLHALSFVYASPETAYPSFIQVYIEKEKPTIFPPLSHTIYVATSSFLSHISLCSH